MSGHPGRARAQHRRARTRPSTTASPSCCRAIRTPTAIPIPIPTPIPTPTAIPILTPGSRSRSRSRSDSDRDPDPDPDPGQTRARPAALRAMRPRALPVCLPIHCHPSPPRHTHPISTRNLAGGSDSPPTEVDKQRSFVTTMSGLSDSRSSENDAARQAPDSAARALDVFSLARPLRPTPVPALARWSTAPHLAEVRWDSRCARRARAREKNIVDHPSWATGPPGGPHTDPRVPTAPPTGP